MARTNISRLSVIITATTSSFARSIQRAQRRTDAFRQAIKISSLRLAQFGAVAATAAAVGLTLLVKTSLRNIDALAKTSSKLNVATEKMAAFQLAAKITGVENTVLEKGFLKMTTGIAEAATGLGEAQAALQALNLDAKKLNQLSPDKQFLSIAVAMEGLTNANNRLLVVTDIFGSRGSSLINTLALGSKGLATAEFLTRKFGTALSSIDVKKIEEANDSVTIFREALAGIGSQITIKVAPAITFLGNKLSALNADGQKFGSFMTFSINQIVKGFRLLDRTILESRVGLLNLAGNALDFADSFVASLNALSNTPAFRMLTASPLRNLLGKGLSGLGINPFEGASGGSILKGIREKRGAIGDAREQLDLKRQINAAPFGDFIEKLFDPSNVSLFQQGPQVALPDGGFGPGELDLGTGLEKALEGTANSVDKLKDTIKKAATGQFQQRKLSGVAGITRGGGGISAQFAQPTMANPNINPITTSRIDLTPIEFGGGTVRGAGVVPGSGMSMERTNELLAQLVRNTAGPQGAVFS